MGGHVCMHGRLHGGRVGAGAGHTWVSCAHAQGVGRTGDMHIALWVCAHTLSALGIKKVGHPCDSTFSDRHILLMSISFQELPVPLADARSISEDTPEEMSHTCRKICYRIPPDVLPL